MNMKRKVLTMMMSVMLLFVSACMWSLSANAQTAQVYDLRLEPNAVDKGRGMLKVHFHFKCVGAKGHKVHPIAYIQADNGKIHTYKNGKQAACSGKSRVAPYESTVWKGDEWLGFYKDRLTVLPGKHTYHVRVLVYDDTLKRYITNTKNVPRVSYTMTGRQSAPSTPSAPSGGYVPYTPSTPMTCGVCSGSGRCSTCGGTGISPNHAPGIEAGCGACGGTGTCSACHGMGYHN